MVSWYREVSGPNAVEDTSNPDPETPSKHAIEDDLRYRISGEASSPTLLYLPGVHGDWTPQAAAAPILAEHFRLIETAYPKNPAWALSEFVAAVVRLLDRLKIPSTHLAAESFGSLVGQQFALEHPERVQSLTIVGGFTRAPDARMIRLTRLGLERLPTRLFEGGVDVYVALRRNRGALHPTPHQVDLPYDAVRTEAGRRATVRRFEIIGQTDLRPRLHELQLPVRYLGGEHDLIVPTKREIATLEELLPDSAAFESHLIAKGPHMIIASHAEETVKRIVEWWTDSSQTLE